VVGQEQRISSKMQVVNCKGEQETEKNSNLFDQNHSFCHPEMLLFRIWSLILSEYGESRTEN